uniref:Cytochrome b5 n=1 Tax=Elaeophora elaphi TaxID=1147741 RepID=A0A0R3S2Y3_9BILA
MTDLERVTRAQVAQHSTSSSSWICIGNKVYDLTTFLDEASSFSIIEFGNHPGGSEVLLKLSGLDATEAYEDIGHSTDAQLLKENYLVAEIVDAEKMKYSYDKKKRPEKEDNIAKKKR